MKYIFVKDLHLVTKSTQVRYRKGDIVELNEQEALTYISMGALTKNVTTVRVIKEELDTLGIDYPSKAKKAELLELYENSQ